VPWFFLTLDSLIDRPVFTTSDFAKRTGIPRPSAVVILKALENESVVVTVRKARGSRAALMVFPELIALVGRK